MDLIIEQITNPLLSLHEPRHCSLHAKTFYYYPHNRRGTLYSLGLNHYTTTEIKNIMQVLDCLFNIDFYDENYSC